METPPDNQSRSLRGKGSGANESVRRASCQAKGAARRCARRMATGVSCRMESRSTSPQNPRALARAPGVSPEMTFALLVCVGLRVRPEVCTSGQVTQAAPQASASAERRNMWSRLGRAEILAAFLAQLATLITASSPHHGGRRSAADSPPAPTGGHRWRRLLSPTARRPDAQAADAHGEALALEPARRSFRAWTIRATRSGRSAWHSWFTGFSTKSASRT
jgi:hypothetical protein